MLHATRSLLNGILDVILDGEDEVETKQSEAQVRPMERRMIDSAHVANIKNTGYGPNFLVEYIYPTFRRKLVRIRIYPVRRVVLVYFSSSLSTTNHHHRRQWPLAALSFAPSPLSAPSPPRRGGSCRLAGRCPRSLWKAKLVTTVLCLAPCY